MGPLLRLIRTRSFLVVLVCLILASSMLFAPTLRSLIGQSSNPMKGQQPPVMIGWGGLRLDSATTTCSIVCYHNSTYAPSNVFPGQNQSDMERLVVRMKAIGLNTIRVSFAPSCTSPADHDDSLYSSSDAQNMIKIANYYRFWIVLRYDGDNDISTATTCWVSYWQPIIKELGPLYDLIAWEPINEPNASVTTLSSTYQQWINMARNTGDQHFIVVENQCSSRCPYSDLSQGYPIVNDTLGKILISLHNYMSYRYSTWTTAAAISYAKKDYQAVLKGEQITGWYALDTEGGPDPQISTCNGPNGTTSGCPPDDILPGSAGYTNVSMTFIQTLTQLFDSHNPRIDWVWWPAGTWIDTPCAGTYGALQPAYCPGGTRYSGGVGWANLLNYVPVNGTSPRFPLSGNFTSTPGWLSVSASLNFNAQATGGLAPYGFSWILGDGATATGSSIRHTYPSPGQYIVTLTIVDEMNRTFTTSRTVMVVAPLSGAFTSSPLTPSAGTTITFMASGSGGVPPYSFSWDFGDGATANGDTSTHSYANPGNYTVTLVTSDSSERTASRSQVVDVHARRPPSGGICLPCLFTDLLPKLSMLPVGAALGLFTVAGLYVGRNRFRGLRKSVTARDSSSESEDR